MDGIEQETAVVRKSEPAVQTGEPEHYRVFCSFGSTPVRNFELFYAELDAHSSNASIGHSEKAQEYIYMIQGELSFRQKPETISLQRGMPSPLIPPSDILISIRRMPWLNLWSSIFIRIDFSLILHYSTHKITLFFTTIRAGPRWHRAPVEDHRLESQNHTDKTHWQAVWWTLPVSCISSILWYGGPCGKCAVTGRLPAVLPVCLLLPACK